MDFVPGHALFRKNVPGGLFGQKREYKLHKHVLTLSKCLSIRVGGMRTPFHFSIVYPSIYR